jgi:hypothetical protein
VKPKKKKTRRGTRGRGRGRTKTAEGASESTQASAPAPAHAAGASKPAASVATVHVRTDSTDRHLVLGDEPVNPQPLQRPRTYRDLDHIPDDLD